MGFWEQILDYFTRVDDILREFKDSYITKSDTIINKLTEIYTALTGEEPEPDIPHRHVPFYSEGTVTAGTDVVLLVKDDSEQGLGDVGRSGFIINDGAGTMYAIIDDGDGKSKDIRIDSGETIEFERGDDIWMSKVTLYCSVGSNAYRCLFSR